MSIAFHDIAPATSGGSSVSSLTISVPLVNNGEALVAALFVGNSAGILPTITAPGGWTLVRSDNDPGSNTLKCALYARVASSEPGSYQWTFNVSVPANGFIASYSGTDGTTPVDVSGGQGNASSTNVVAPSVTTTAASDQLLFVGATNQAATVTVPAGETNRQTGSNKPGYGFGDEALGAAGSTGTRTGTTGVAAINVGQLIALKPAAAAPATDASVLCRKRRRGRGKGGRRRHRRPAADALVQAILPSSDLTGLFVRPKRRRTFKEVRRKVRPNHRHPFADKSPVLPLWLVQMDATALVQETWNAAALVQETYAAAGSTSETFSATATVDP